MPVLWVLWGIGVLNVAALVVSGWVYQILARSRDIGCPGPQVFLIVLAFVTMPVGGLSGLLLILLADVGVGWFVGLIAGTAVLLSLPALVLVSWAGAGWRSYRRHRALTARHW